MKLAFNCQMSSQRKDVGIKGVLAGQKPWSPKQGEAPPPPAPPPANPHTPIPVQNCSFITAIQLTRHKKFPEAEDPLKTQPASVLANLTVKPQHVLHFDRDSGEMNTG